MKLRLTFSARMDQRLRRPKNFDNVHSMMEWCEKNLADRNADAYLVTGGHLIRVCRIEKAGKKVVWSKSWLELRDAVARF